MNELISNSRTAKLVTKLRSEYGQLNGTTDGFKYHLEHRAGLRMIVPMRSRDVARWVKDSDETYEIVNKEYYLMFLLQYE